jgi:hypothetical protein
MRTTSGSGEAPKLEFGSALNCINQIKSYETKNQTVSYIGLEAAHGPRTFFGSIKSTFLCFFWKKHKFVHQKHAR